MDLKIVIFDAEPMKGGAKVIVLRNVKQGVDKIDVEMAIRNIVSKMGDLE